MPLAPPVQVRLTVNGTSHTLTTDPGRPLLEVLREDLSLTGTHYGCGEGQCGACSVLLNGSRIFSCSTAVSQLPPDAKITTIEGLAQGESLHPVQQAFLENNAFQCGYCTPGMIVTAVAVLNRNPDATEEQIKSAMNLNLCRCCGYGVIFPAICEAARKMKEGVK